MGHLTLFWHISAHDMNTCVHTRTIHAYTCTHTIKNLEMQYKSPQIIGLERILEIVQFDFLFNA